MTHKQMLVASSLLSILLWTIHFTGDIQYGMSARGLNNLVGILILLVWLYGTLMLSDRIPGLVIMLLGGIFAAAMPVLHMRGRGLRPEASDVFIWTLLMLGLLGSFAVILVLHEFWDRRRRAPD